MKKKLQSVIDEINREGSTTISFSVMAFAPGGIEGLVSQKIPMVFVRAHDCLTFLLGSRERHEQIYKEHPDAYWYSPGWIETGSQPSKERIQKSFDLLKNKYGEEEAKILLPELESWIRNYHKAIYIDLDIGPREKFLDYTKKCAEELGWKLIELDRRCNAGQKFIWLQMERKRFPDRATRLRSQIRLDRKNY